MTFDRTAYGTAYARRSRARKDAAANASERTCQHRLGSGRCGGMLETHTNGDGTIRVICPSCQRRWAGLCADCNAPVEGRIGSAVRCAVHKKTRAAEHQRAYRQDDPAELRARARRYYRADATRRKARNDYKRAWRKANRDKVRAQKRRYALKGLAAAAQRRHRARLGGSTPPALRVEPRTCLTPGCDIMLTGRKKLCTKCKDRQAAVARQHPAIGRGQGRDRMAAA